MKNNTVLNYAEIRSRLAGRTGPAVWRSLDELGDTPAFREMLHREFPEGASEWNDEVSRRNFLRFMGASLALAGYAGCGRPPAEKIVPYVVPPETVIPGEPLFFATAMPFSGYGRGLIVESHTGRPTKVEGNPDHPASLGATDSFGQSSVLTLYDPDRSRLAIERGNPSDWGGFIGATASRLGAIRDAKGASLCILTETVTSPTLANQIQQLLGRLPEARWHQYDPVNRDSIHSGTQQAFGVPLNPVYHFDRAKVILSLESDFLIEEPGSLRYARDFINMRRVSATRADMNRLYVVEPTPTVTGSMADHRLRLKSSQVEAYARWIAQRLGVRTGTGDVDTRGEEPPWIAAVADDLRQHGGDSLVVAGRSQPAAVHAIACAINERLGAIGRTVTYTDPIEATAGSHRESLEALVSDMRSGAVEVLVIIGGNPVYTAPADLAFGENLLNFARMQKPDGSFRNLAVHLSLYHDETSFLCHWHLPQTHFLESWGDVRAYDGTASIIQPLIAPLYRGKSAHELVALLGGELDATTYDIVRRYWRERVGERNFERVWEAWLEKGVVPDTAAVPRQVRMQDLSTRPAEDAATQPAGGSGAFEIVFRPDPTIWDGSFANNGWQQELPKPLMQLTWENAALISLKAAEQLHLHTGDVIKLILGGRSVEAPVLVAPGQHDDAITVTLGYGRWRGGSLASPNDVPAGFNAYALRSAAQPWFAPGASIEKTGRSAELALVDMHHLMAAEDLRPSAVANATTRPGDEHAHNNRKLVRVGTLAEFKAVPDFAQRMRHESAEHIQSLLPRWEYKGNKWGMSINLNACIGCSACVVACQAENNIPVVGKDQVLRGREMHWLRIDRYYDGAPENPKVYHQPVPCMHCEKAPCEIVCPVAATVHDSEGLNNMVYNRCVGTRYCSNNCPYKVRRFNFYEYSDRVHPTVAMQKNPNVSVRARGVMEKCTYCIQRIAKARIEAEKENRRIRDGEVLTACQQACPTQAIAFGDLNDPASAVRREKETPLAYGILTELTTIPRTTYLARLRNPNPALEAEDAT